MFSYGIVGNCLFLLGSLLFTLDSMNSAWEVCSMRSFVVLTACGLFTIGCLLFLVPAKADSQQQVEVKQLPYTSEQAGLLRSQCRLMVDNLCIQPHQVQSRESEHQALILRFRCHGKSEGNVIFGSSDFRNIAFGTNEVLHDKEVLIYSRCCAFFNSSTIVVGLIYGRGPYREYRY